jgi:hypothetical protein
MSSALKHPCDEAFVSGYRVVMLVATAASLASALGAALLIEGKKEQEEQPDDPETEALAA